MLYSLTPCPKENCGLLSFCGLFTLLGPSVPFAACTPSHNKGIVTFDSHPTTYTSTISSGCS